MAMWIESDPSVSKQDHIRVYIYHQLIHAQKHKANRITLLQSLGARLWTPVVKK